MDNYYDRLDNKEKTLYWNSVSWNDTNLAFLTKHDNCYSQKKNSNDILLIITDIKNNCMYIFESYY